MEYAMIKVQRFRDPAQQPTCASDFEKGEVCQFYMTRSFGQRELCGLNLETLRRVDNGFLTPLPRCPVWANP